MKTWFITGVSRGLGLEIARAALHAGHRVAGTSRSISPLFEEFPERFLPLPCDLSKSDDVGQAVSAAFSAFGQIDVLVNNAGYGLLGAVEQSTDEEMTDLFEIDVFAPIRIVRQAIPHLRKQQGGHIINITSIAGRAPGTGAALYAAAKASMEIFSAALAQEVAPFGIRVTAVAPGQFRTAFLSEQSVRKSKPIDGVYSSNLDTALQSLASLDRKQLGDPAAAARAILDLAASDDPPVHLLLGSDALVRDRARADLIAAEIERWKATTLSTDFPPANGNSAR